jgi:hypothetical protein
MIETHIAVGGFIFGIALGFMLCFFGVPFLVNTSRRAKASFREGMADWREGNDAKRN